VTATSIGIDRFDVRVRESWIWLSAGFTRRSWYQSVLTSFTVPKAYPFVIYKDTESQVGKKSEIG
jgi:hypothetical protein